MVDRKKSLFRKESLERLSSPEQLDQLMQVVRFSDWIPLATLSVLVLLVGIWSVVARIPITVSGRGILIQPQKKGQPIASDRLINVAYFKIGDGKRIQPGMKVTIAPDTVKRERFGDILGSVTSVSPFPVTEQSAGALIGNIELATALISHSGQMQVITELNLDPSTFSGYEWSSAKRSPHQKLSPGTTTSVRVTLEEKAPISFVLPILDN
jgi:hypothetical protein